MEQLKLWGFSIKLGKVLRRRMRADQETAAKQAQRFANLNDTEIVYWDEATPTVMVPVHPRIVMAMPVARKQFGT